MNQRGCSRVTRLFLASLLGACAASTPVAQAAQPTRGSHPSAPPTAQAPAGAGAPGTTPGAGAAKFRMAERLWWNQPQMAKSLELTDEQRAQMDKLLAKSQEEQQAAQQKQINKRKAFQESLAHGDWESARRAATEMRDGVAAAYATQNTLKIDVLAMLNKDQRQTFVSKYSYLLQRPWTLGMGGLGMGGMGGGGMDGPGTGGPGMGGPGGGAPQWWGHRRGGGQPPAK